MAAKKTAKAPAKTAPSAPLALSGEALSIEDAVARAIARLAAAIDVPWAPREVTYAGRELSLRAAEDRATTGALSAPRMLFTTLWKDVPTLSDRIWTVPGGRWDLLRTTLQCDEDLQADWLAISDAILASGDREEAQLVWLQADDFANTNQKSARFKALFPSVPAVAKISVARSAAAFVERILPLVSEGSVVDRFIAAQGALDNILEARSDVDGARRSKLLASYDDAVAALEAHTSPALREVARLMRGMRANCE